MLSDVDDFTFLFCWYEGYWAYMPCGSNPRRCCCTCRRAAALPVSYVSRRSSPSVTDTELLARDS
jgi:hypothetical protein